jgi:hypothetical protein
MRSDIADVECILHHMTDKAIKVSEYEGAEEVWLPLSLIEYTRDTQNPRIVTVTAPQCLLEEKGLL